MKTYLDALKYVLDNGTVREDRTGTGTIGVFGMQQRYDLSRGFPAVTTKKLAWRAVVGELLWMIEGSGDERRLAEITHGTREGNTTIWTPNALAPYWKPKAKFEGDLGRVYGVQWRHWHTYQHREAGSYTNDFGHTYSTPGGVIEHKVDQLQDLIAGLKSDPYGRRHVLTAWNPGELDQMALPPCHMFAQFYVSKDRRLSCQMYQRSCDMFLGVPFNIASYALLTHMMAQQCNLEVGDFIWTGGDCHLYSNHLEQVELQLSRDFFPLPKLNILRKPDSIFDYEFEDFEIVGYESHPHIKAPVAI
jgi:thymidylate synthase